MWIRERDWRQRKQREQESLSCSFRDFFFFFSFKLESNDAFYFVCVCVCFYFFKKRTLTSALFQPFPDWIGLRPNQKSKEEKNASMCIDSHTVCPCMLDASASPLEAHPCFPKSQSDSFFFFNNYKKIYFSFLYIPFSFWVFLIFFWGGFVAKGFVNVRFGQFNLLFCLGFSLLLNYFSRVCFKRVCLGNSISLFVWLI